MIRPILINLSPVELKYYPFMISRYKCSGSYNLVDDLFNKLWALSKAMQQMFKVFNMVTNRTETKFI